MLANFTPRSHLRGHGVLGTRASRPQMGSATASPSHQCGRDARVPRTPCPRAFARGVPGENPTAHMPRSDGKPGRTVRNLVTSRRPAGRDRAMIRAYDIFSGLGGGSYGAAAAGATIVGSIDAWDLAAQVFADNFPSARVSRGEPSRSRSRAASSSRWAGSTFSWRRRSARTTVAPVERVRARTGAAISHSRSCGTPAPSRPGGS